MPIAAPKRFSRDWWLTLLVVTVGISVATFLLFRDRGLHPAELVLYCLGMSFLGDLVTALSMENKQGQCKLFRAIESKRYTDPTYFPVTCVQNEG